MKDTVSTTNHKEVKLWVEERKGMPSILKETSPEASNQILRIYFGNNPANGADMKSITWNKFFEEFENNNLAFVYRHENFGGQNSTFHRFVFRDDIGAQA